MNFCTLYPEGTDLDLVKDVGQIPYNLSLYHKSIHAKLVCCNITDPDQIDNKHGSFTIENINKIFNSKMVTGCLYILKHSNEIDWLNLYHSGRCTWIWSKIFKTLNPKGKVYLKLDLDFNGCDSLDLIKKEKIRFVRGIKYADIVSVESKAVANRIKNYTNKEVKIIPDGYYFPYDTISDKVQRKNTILSVGRLGTRQKATETLIEAFMLGQEYHDWTLRLIGTQTEDFKRWCDVFFRSHPELIPRIQLVGEILDRRRLIEEYQSAKVFILPSRWESFGIVAVEAIANGCRVILTDQCPAASEITYNEKYGKIIKADDVKGTMHAILDEINGYQHTKAQHEEICEYAKNNFSWRVICDLLYSYLSEFRD